HSTGIDGRILRDAAARLLRIRSEIGASDVQSNANSRSVDAPPSCEERGNAARLEPPGQTWMGGTSARSKASSARPAMTPMELNDNTETEKPSSPGLSL